MMFFFYKRWNCRTLLFLFLINNFITQSCIFYLLLPFVRPFAFSYDGRKNVSRSTKYVRNSELYKSTKCTEIEDPLQFAFSYTFNIYYYYTPINTIQDNLDQLFYYFN